MIALMVVMERWSLEFSKRIGKEWAMHKMRRAKRGSSPSSGRRWRSREWLQG